MNNEYRFERLNEKNIIDLLPLYLDAFHEVRSIDIVRAKFDTASFGAKNWAFIAYANDNTAAALYALFPVIITKNEREILAGQVGDLMTHSNHRRKGLYITLADMTHQLARLEGVELIFTVPYGENASYQGFMNRLNFIHTHNLNGYYFKVNAFPTFLFTSKSHFINQIYLAFAKQILSRLFSIVYSFKNDLVSDYAEVIRSNSFFDYKKKYSQTYVMQIDNVAVWFKIDKGSLKVGDIEKKSNKNFENILIGLKWVAFALGIRIIQFEASPDTYLDKLLQKIATPICNYRVCLLNFSNLSDTDFKFTFADLDNF